MTAHQSMLWEDDGGPPAKEDDTTGLYRMSPTGNMAFGWPVVIGQLDEPPTPAPISVPWESPYPGYWSSKTPFYRFWNRYRSKWVHWHIFRRLVASFSCSMQMNSWSFGGNVGLSMDESPGPAITLLIGPIRIWCFLGWRSLEWLRE